MKSKETLRFLVDLLYTLISRFIFYLSFLSFQRLLSRVESCSNSIVNYGLSKMIFAIILTISRRRLQQDSVPGDDRAPLGLPLPGPSGFPNDHVDRQVSPWLSGEEVPGYRGEPPWRQPHRDDDYGLPIVQPRARRRLRDDSVQFVYGDIRVSIRRHACCTDELVSRQNSDVLLTFLLVKRLCRDRQVPGRTLVRRQREEFLRRGDEHAQGQLCPSHFLHEQPGYRRGR